ncbi:proline-rich protein 22 [Pezoporus occidentalis]|uniref:proline-rich protein 22 n=1 Tax=Pezoporus occidentalis TaxID=407982 RepID=UPI002F9187A7
MAPVSLSGQANLCQPLPTLANCQQQPFPASWIPWRAWSHSDEQEPPAGMQRAPCGCFFNPQHFSVQWTVPRPPPADTCTPGFSAATLPGAALLGTGYCGTLLAWAAPGTPQGPAQHLAPHNHQGTGAAAPVLPEPNPRNPHINGVPAGNNIASMNTSMGIAPGNNIPTGSNVLLNRSSNHQNQRLGEPDADIEVTEEMLLKEALRLFGMSEEMEAVIQHGSSSVIMPEDHDDAIRKARTLAPAAPDLLNSIPSNKYIDGVSAQPNTPSTATSVGTTLGINIPPGNDVPPSSFSDPHHQGFEDMNDNLARDKEVPLDEALRFFGCYEDTERVIQEGPSSSRIPEDPGGTDTDISLCDFTSLSLPDELLTCDYDANEIAKAIQSLEDFTSLSLPAELLTCDYDVNEIAKDIQSLEDIVDTGKYPHDFWADVGMDLEPSQPDGAEYWGIK